MQSITDAMTLVPSRSNRIDTEVHHEGTGFQSLQNIIDYAIVPAAETADALFYSIQGQIERMHRQRELRRKLEQAAAVEVARDEKRKSKKKDNDHEALEAFARVALSGAKEIGLFGLRVVAGWLFDALAFIAEDVLWGMGRLFISWVIEPVLMAAGAIFLNPIGLAALASLGAVGVGWWLINKLLDKGNPNVSEAHKAAVSGQPMLDDSTALFPSRFEDFLPQSGAAYPRAAGQPEIAGAPAQAPGTPIQPKPYTGGNISLEEAARAAQVSEDRTGIPAVVSLAQFNLESGGGKHMPAGSNNPFGIKARNGDPYVEAWTTEHVGGKDVRVVQRFRAFSSLDEAFEAHGRLLANGRPYANARTHLNDPAAFANALTGVYATDPNYGTKLISQFPRLQGVLNAVNTKTTSVQNGQQVTDKPIPATKPAEATPQAPQAAAAVPPQAGPVAAQQPRNIIKGPGKTLVAVR